MYLSKKHYTKHGRKSKRGGGSTQMGGQMSKSRYLEHILQVKKKDRDERGGRIANTFNVDRKTFKKGHPLWCGAAGNRGQGCRTIKKKANRANIKVPSYDYYVKWFKNKKVFPNKSLSKTDLFDYSLWATARALEVKTKLANKKKKESEMRLKSAKKRLKDEEKRLKDAAEKEKREVEEAAQTIIDAREAALPMWWKRAKDTKNKKDKMNRAIKADKDDHEQYIKKMNEQKAAAAAARQLAVKKELSAKARQLKANNARRPGASRRSAAVKQQRETEQQARARATKEAKGIHKWLQYLGSATMSAVKQADDLINFFKSKKNPTPDDIAVYKNNLKKLKKVENTFTQIEDSRSYKTSRDKLIALTTNPYAQQNDIQNLHKVYQILKKRLDNKSNALKVKNLYISPTNIEKMHRNQRGLSSDGVKTSSQFQRDQTTALEQQSKKPTLIRIFRTFVMNKNTLIPHDQRANAENEFKGILQIEDMPTRYNRALEFEKKYLTPPPPPPLAMSKKIPT